MRAALFVPVSKSQALGLKPGTSAESSRVDGAHLLRPGVGWKSYMNFQMMPAATKEMAIGRNTRALATASYLTRSARRAMSSPRVKCNEGEENEPQPVVPQHDQHVFVGEDVPVVLEPDEELWSDASFRLKAIVVTIG